MTDRTVTAFLKANVNDFNRGVLSAAATTKTFTKELDSSNERMSWMVQSALALGPALVPIGATAVPVISGLTNQLAFAAAGAGVTALALSGVGGALQAVNEYQIEPTTANFEKLQQSMDKLGPAGREFVGFLQEIRPQLQGLQDAAQEGLLPGLETGIRELMVVLPEVQGIVSEIAGGLGDLMAEAGDNLNDARWLEFFEFLEAEARPTLIDMGRTLGNFAEGLANLWMAFDPLSDDFSSSFLEMSRDFATWTDGLSDTEGFQDFLDYVSRVGPQVWDTLGALGNALLQVVVAAAPIGEATLPILEAVADVLAAIASSPVGPVLIGAAAGISALSRAVALYNIANGAAMTSMITKLGGKGAALRATAGGVGLVALSMTDLDEKMGLSNTAMLASAGLIAGPWGAAVGGAVGLVLDLSSANEESTASINRANDAIQANTLSIEEQAAALQAAKDSGSDGGFDGKINDAALIALEAQLSLNARAAEDAAFEEAGLGSALDGASDATREQTRALMDNIAAHNARADQLLAQSNAEIAYEQAVDDATATIKENGQNLDIGTQKGRENQLALDGMAAAWNNLPAASQNAEGALEQAKNAYIRASIAAGNTRQASRELADALFDIPEIVPIDIQARGAAKTKSDIDAIRTALARLPKTTNLTIRTFRETYGRASGGSREDGVPRATGGPVYGPGTGTSDSIPAWLSNGEYVVNAAATRANFGLLEAINNGGRAQRFADGGYAIQTAAAFGPSFDASPAVTPSAIRSALEGMSLEVSLTGSDRGKAHFVQDGLKAGKRL